MSTPNFGLVPNVYEDRRRDPGYLAVMNCSTTDAKFHFGPRNTRPVAKTLQAGQWRDRGRCAIQQIRKSDKLSLMKQAGKEKIRFIASDLAADFLTKCHAKSAENPSSPDFQVYEAVYYEMFGEKLRVVGKNDLELQRRNALLRRLASCGVDTDALLVHEPTVTTARLRYYIRFPEKAVFVAEGATLPVVIDIRKLAHVEDGTGLPRSGDTRALMEARIEYGRMTTALGLPQAPSDWNEKRIRDAMAELKAYVAKAASSPTQIVTVPSAYDQEVKVNTKSSGASTPPGEAVGQ